MISTNEIIGTITTVLAITGVLLNNRKLKACFLLWMLSNALSAGIHFDSNIWSLFIRDVIFFILAIEGWFKWGRKIKRL